MQVVEKINPTVRQYLIFSLADEAYAVDVAAVQELRGRERPTPCSQVPAFVRGVINLRGMLVPIVDLRCCLGLPVRADGPNTAVIIINLRDEDIVVGLVVDAISDVCGIDSQQLRSDLDQVSSGMVSVGRNLRPSMANNFINAWAVQSQQSIAVLDIHRLIHDGVLSSKTETSAALEVDQACA